MEAAIIKMISMLLELDYRTLGYFALNYMDSIS
jgi:hypothetical protein